MSRTRWGTFYLIPRDVTGDAESAADHVVETHRHGPSEVALSIELWRLIGHEERAQSLSNIVDRAYQRGEARFDDRDLDELLAGTEDLEEHVAKVLLDEQGLVPQDKLEDLRARSRLLEISEQRGASARYGVDEALTRVYGMRQVLQSARARGLHIALDGG